jgi:hypothetical protein
MDSLMASLITPTAIVCTIFTIMAIGWKVRKISAAITKLTETQTLFQANMVNYQKEMLKESRTQTRLYAQLLKAYGHEPDLGRLD